MFIKQFFFILFIRFAFSADPENVACTPTSLETNIIFMDCRAYPGSRLMNIRINNSTFPTPLDDAKLFSSCSPIDPDSVHRYCTVECRIGISLNHLQLGNNHIEVTFSTMATDSNLTITSNNIVIPVNDELQEPTCGQPVFQENGTSFNYVCTATLIFEFENVVCVLRSRTNGTVIRTVDAVMSSSTLELNKTFATQCSFVVMTSDLGAGQHELQANMSTKMNDGKRVSASSNWTSLLNFYPATKMNFTVNGSPEGVVVKSGDLIILYCNVDGFPASKLTLSQDNVWRSEFGSSPFSIGTRHSFRITGCSHADVYTCSSIGSLSRSGETFTKTVYVDIPCQLQLRSKRYSGNNFFSLGTFTNTTVVRIDVFGYPGPKSMKLLNSEKDLHNGDVNVVYTQQLGPYGTIEVTFNNTELIRNLGHFQLNVDNGVDNTSFAFYIQAASGMSINESKTSLCICFAYILSRIIS